MPKDWQHLRPKNMNDDLPQSEIIRLNGVIRAIKKGRQTLEDGCRQHQDKQAVQSPVQWPKCAGCRLDGKCEYQAEEIEHGVEHTDNCPKIHRIRYYLYQKS